jgi:methionyl aminopeptidase
MEKQEKEEIKNLDQQNIQICSKLGCSNTGKLRCPECMKLKIKEGSYFCGKECFKSYWNSHKKLHEECK